MDDYYMLKAMKLYGGSFVKSLADCIMFADSDNLRKIKETWAEEIKKYEAMGKILNEREERELKE